MKANKKELLLTSAVSLTPLLTGAMLFRAVFLSNEPYPRAPPPNGRIPYAVLLVLLPMALLHLRL